MRRIILICLFFVWILNWLFSFFPCLSPTLLIFLVRENTKPLFFLVQLYSWDVVLLSKHSLNYTGIFSQFALSKSHLNSSKYCTIASPAVFFAVTLYFNIALRKVLQMCWLPCRVYWYHLWNVKIIKVIISSSGRLKVAGFVRSWVSKKFLSFAFEFWKVFW